MGEEKETAIGSPVGWAVLIAVILGCCQLPFSSFMADDFIFLGILEKVSPFSWNGPFTLYSLSDGKAEHLQIAKESGAFPWFFHPQFKMNFFRPLSSGLLALDHALFGLNPVGYGIHNILWLIVLITGVGVLFKRIIPGTTGSLALIIYVLSGIFYASLFWAACRHNLIAPAIGLWAFLAYLNWSEKEKTVFLILSLAGFALAFMAGEAAMGMIAFPVVYECIGKKESWRRRFKFLLPVLLLSSFYLLFYKIGDYGASSGSEYVNPFSQPLIFLWKLPQHLLAMIGSLFLGGAADVFAVNSDLILFLVIWGAVSVILFYLLLRSIWCVLAESEKKTVLRFSVGAVLSYLPFATSMVISFHLIIPFIGGSVVIACILHHWWMNLRKRSGFYFGCLKVACVLLAFLHLVLAPVMRLTAPALLKKKMFSNLESTMRNLDREVKDIGQRRVIILNAPDVVVGLHSFFFRQLYRLPMPESWQVLSWVQGDCRISRTDDATFIMEFVDNSLGTTSFHVGERVNLSGMHITILRTDKKGIKAIECKIDHSLEDSSLLFLSWQDGRLRPIRMPGIGQSGTISSTSAQARQEACQRFLLLRATIIATASHGGTDRIHAEGSC